MNNNLESERKNNKHCKEWHGDEIKELDNVKIQKKK